MTADRLARIERVRGRMADLGVDALLLSLGADLPWLTGYEAPPLERLTIFLGEGDVSPKFSDRTSRLQPAHHIAFRQVLVFRAHWRMGKNASLF